MRREDFGVALALMLIVSLGMAGGIGEALLGRNAIGCALLGRTAIGRALHAHNATGDLGAGAAPVILEVIPTDKRTHGPAEGLTQDDFEIVEGRSVAQITSLAHGSEGARRPLSLWLVVQCPEEHSYSSWVSNGSGFMKGKTTTLTPVQTNLNARDTVGVAHWCDNGEVGVDLLPSTDRVAPQNVLDAVLNTTRTNVARIPGVNALHNMVIRVRDTARRLTPKALPVIILL